MAAGVLFSSAPGSTAPSREQAPPADGPVRYEASFYAQFSPQTALDMIVHTPGFVLETGEAEDERRGFEGAVANVLVDGERPIAKRGTIEEVLQRIPAARVARIELLRVADTAGDASGSAIIANVVLLPTRRYGVWSAGFELAGQHRPSPNGFLSAGGRFKANEYAINASSYSLLRVLPGTRTLVEPSGVPTVSRRIESPRHFHEYAVNGQVVRPAGRGRLEITGKVDYAGYDEDTAFRIVATDGTVVGVEAIPYAQGEWRTEGGVSYKRAASGWEMSLLALATRRSFESDVTATSSTGAGPQSTVAQLLRRRTAESIVRATAERGLRRHRLQVGCEGTLNTLDGRTRLTLDAGDGPSELSVPNAGVRVRERRAEVFVADTWRSPGGWSAEGRLAIELSHLRFAGDVARSALLAYEKPSLQVARTFSARHQARVRVARQIGQLDFADFVSSASLADNQLTGGNPGLRPQSSWRAELGVDLRAGRDAALGVTAFQDWFDNVVDWIPWGGPAERIDAPGNLGRASASGVTFTARVPVRPVPGLAVTAAATVQRASVADPVTGARRSISEMERLRLTAGVRQDLLASKVALGADYRFRSATRSFRLREIDEQRPSPSLDLFLEVPLPRSLKLRAQMLSVLGAPELRRRTFFEPDRAHDVTGIEHTRRQPGQWWLVTLSGSF